jgi:hypothetical protein
METQLTNDERTYRLRHKEALRITKYDYLSVELNRFAVALAM